VESDEKRDKKVEGIGEEREKDCDLLKGRRKKGKKCVIKKRDK